MAKKQSLDASIRTAFQGVLQKGVLSHAYLFSGGAATLELAIYLTQSRFCLDLVDGLPCDSCRNCRMVREKSYPDMHVIAPSGNLIKTQDIRDLVGQVSTAGLEGRVQVFIVQEAEKMHPNGANALLKVMEEPTGQYYIFLLSRDSELVLSTIRSRCQQFQLPQQSDYWQLDLQTAGYSLTQAKLLSPLLSRTDLYEFCVDNQKKVSDWLRVCQKIITKVLAKDEDVLLEVSRLAQVTDKQEQAFLFDILLGQLSQEGKVAVLAIERLTQAKQMWQVNVNFQASLDYFVLQ